MATYTAGEQINRALRLLGVLAEGETPSADMSNDALTALDQMIDSWNTERLSVFATQDQIFTWPAGEITRTLGPSGSPTRDLEWHFISVEKINQPATLATQMLFPPGYLRAFTYNLAMEIAPEYGIEPSPQVQRIAMTSKRNLKRINNPDDVMSMPYAIVATRQRFNVYAGNY
jgi:hypothetical protein